MKPTLSTFNEMLLTKTQTLVQEERRITLELIECLEQISNRMLYAELGYGSLFDFCTRHLGLSEGSAHRRIAAMRLTRDVPSARDKLRSGELSLTNAAKIQVASNRVLKKSQAQAASQKKTELVEACTNLSQSQCDAKLLVALPGLQETSAYTERKRQVDESLTELKLLLSAELYHKLERLLNLNAHTNPQKSVIRLLERLVDQELGKVEKQRGLQPSNQVDYKGINPAAGFSSGEPANHSNPFRSRYIPVQTRRLVWARASGRCQYPKCGSTYLLEIEHHKPFAKGGTHVPNNLALYCRTHNVLAAKREFKVI
jgi:hypothetical protein